MDKNQLKNFVSLAQVLNFSSVAKQQFISQPALTNQISRLEAELGVQLFNRSKHGVSLTHAGAEFYAHAAEILDSIERAERRMEDISKGQTGFLKISAVPGQEREVSRYVEAFHRRYENIQISMGSGTGTEQIMAIHKKAYDIYFSFASLLESQSELDTIPMEPDRYAIYVNSRYGEALRGGELGILNDMSHLMESRADGPFLTPAILSLMETLELKPKKMDYYPSAAIILMAVQAGLGFAILPSQLNMGVTPEQITVLPIDGEEAVIQNAVGWHRDTKNVAALKFIEMLREMKGETERE